MTPSDGLQPCKLYRSKPCPKLFEVVRSPTTIGRRPDCEICLDTPQVSPLHARLVFRRRRWWIEDCESETGTYVNGGQISECTLIVGDEIRVGDVVLKFEMDPMDDSRGRAHSYDLSGDDDTLRRRMYEIERESILWDRPDRIKYETSTIDPERGSSSGLATETRCSALPPLDDAEEVNCTVFAPPVVKLAHPFLVQVFAHLPARAQAAAEEAQLFDEDAKPRGRTSLATEVKRGSVITFSLQLDGAQVNDPIQSVTWRSQNASVQFATVVPGNCSSEVLIGKLTVSQNSIPIGLINFKLTVVNQFAGVTSTVMPVGAAQRYTMAFISYASQDRPEVIRRVQMLKNVGISFVQDILNLAPGEHWARRLYEWIDQSDVLFLFWSTAAKQSAWVTREWQYGLEKKGDNYIHPVPIEGPPIPKPPDALKHLHFGDPLLYFIHPPATPPKSSEH